MPLNTSYSDGQQLLYLFRENLNRFYRVSACLTHDELAAEQIILQAFDALLQNPHRASVRDALREIATASVQIRTTTSRFRD